MQFPGILDYKLDEHWAHLTHSSVCPLRASGKVAESLRRKTDYMPKPEVVP